MENGSSSKIKVAYGVAITLGALVLLTIFVLAVGSFYANWASRKFDEEAVPYLHHVVPIISTWDANEVEKFLAPGLKAEMNEGDLERLLRRAQQTLGTYVRMDRPQLVRFDSSFDVSSGIYYVKTQYQHGTRIVEVILTRASGRGVQVRRIYFHETTNTPVSHLGPVLHVHGALLVHSVATNHSYAQQATTRRAPLTF